MEEVEVDCPAKNTRKANRATGKDTEVKDKDKETGTVSPHTSTPVGKTKRGNSKTPKTPKKSNKKKANKDDGSRDIRSFFTNVPPIDPEIYTTDNHDKSVRGNTWHNISQLSEQVSFVSANSDFYKEIDQQQCANKEDVTTPSANSTIEFESTLEWKEKGVSNSQTDSDDYRDNIYTCEVVDNNIKCVNTAQECEMAETQTEMERVLTLMKEANKGNSGAWD